MFTALLLIPDFALILLGVILRRYMQLGEHFWSGLDKLIYFVLFPSLLFSAIVRTHIDFVAAGHFLSVGLLTLAGGIALGLLARVLFHQPPLVFASHFQCAFRFNSYIGLAVAGKLFGASGISAMAILIGGLVPLANMAAVSMLARYGDGSILRELARNPLIVATLSGVVCNLAGIELFAPLAQLLGRLSDAALASGLLAVGAALKLRHAHIPIVSGAYTTAVKLLAMPAIAWMAGRALGLSGLYFDIAVIFAALPTASSAYILAVRMQGDGPGVAWLISASTLTSMVTLAVWISLLDPLAR